METSEKKTYIFALHEDHEEWLNALAFYEDSLKIYQNRLAEVSNKNTDKDVKVLVERFQNQFIIQKEEIDFLKHEIRLDELALQNEVEKNPTASDHRKVNDNVPLRDRYETFVTLFTSMKEDFNEFAGKNL